MITCQCLLVAILQLDEDSGSSDDEENGKTGETQLYVPPKVRPMHYGECWWWSWCSVNHEMHLDVCKMRTVVQPSSRGPQRSWRKGLWRALWCRNFERSCKTCHLKWRCVCWYTTCQLDYISLASFKQCKIVAAMAVEQLEISPCFDLSSIFNILCCSCKCLLWRSRWFFWHVLFFRR